MRSRPYRRISARAMVDKILPIQRIAYRMQAPQKFLQKHRKNQGSQEEIIGCKFEQLLADAVGKNREK